VRIQLKYCTVEANLVHACVRFPDGSYVNAVPHDSHQYHVIAHRCGYEDDILAYCREHEFSHAFIEQELHNRPSRVLYALAHKRPVNDAEHAYEEIAAQTFQRWLRAGERPITSGVDWISLKKKALELLDTKA
jgi:hypothetical protein